MGIRDFFSPSAEALRPRHVFAGWVQGAVLTAILGAVAYLNEAGPLAIALVVVNVGLLSFLVLEKVRNKGAARITVAVLILVGLGFLGWSVWDKRQADAQFELSVGGRTILRGGHKLPTGENQVTSIQTVLDIGNENEFPVYYKIERSFAKLGNTATPLDNPGAQVVPLEPGHGVYIDSEPLPAVLSNGEYHQVQVEYRVLYGRTPDLDKRLTYTGDWQFFLCPVTALLCGDVTATNQKTVQEWVQG